MSKAVINLNVIKICEFCKCWWNPSCKYILPYLYNQWYYEKDAKCCCIKRNI